MPTKEYRKVVASNVVRWLVNGIYMLDEVEAESLVALFRQYDPEQSTYVLSFSQFNRLVDHLNETRIPNGIGI